MTKLRIADAVADYRRAHGLSQGAFGALVGVSAQAVSKWEREICCPDIALLPALSDILGMSVDALLGVG